MQYAEKSTENKSVLQNVNLYNILCLKFNSFYILKIHNNIVFTNSLTKNFNLNILGGEKWL